ncbi:MAG: hypothetical protein RML46_06845 [Anaerolineae bacterium]|nr:hypothetical protein [Anaerolineae bacterium]MDW8068610.1 hypothetical protein [Anaerolineae bacterium]
MFRKNTRHLQIPLTSPVDELPEPMQERLKNFWAETFYREFSCRLDEAPFAVLYADTPSRPNVPVNVRVALEFLKAANGWTDEDIPRILLQRPDALRPGLSASGRRLF